MNCVIEKGLRFEMLPDLLEDVLIVVSFISWDESVGELEDIVVDCSGFRFLVSEKKVGYVSIVEIIHSFTSN